MASLNKVTLIGHLGRDPEIRVTAHGDSICSLSIATSERFEDKAGKQREVTEWHRVVVYRRLAEIARDYLKKGALVYVEGSLKTRKWQDKNELMRYTTEIEAREMKMLGVSTGNDQPVVAPMAIARPANMNGAGRAMATVGDEWDFPF